MIWRNGELRLADDAVSAEDRGLLLAEAVFETLLVRHGIPQAWPAHLARLMAACDAFGIAAPYDEATLRDGAKSLLAATEAAPRCVLRMTVSGGAGGRGLVPARPATPTWLMQLSAAAAPPESLRIHRSRVLRPAGNPSVQHKTSAAYLDNIAARREALAAGADEALLCNQFGRLACAATGNVYVQSGPRLVTPPLQEGALPGIVRAQALAAGQLAGLQIVEGLVDPDMLAAADAAFISNSLAGFVAIGLEAPTEVQKKQGRALSAALPQYREF